MPQPKPQPNDPGALPDNVRSLIEHVGFLPPDVLADDIEEVYAPVRNMQCMTCGAQVGTNTILIITKKGIVGMYCSGPCMQDQAVLGWLEERFTDITQAVSFRGGEGDVPDEDDDTPDPNEPTP